MEILLSVYQNLLIKLKSIKIELNNFNIAALLKRLTLRWSGQSRDIGTDFKFFAAAHLHRWAVRPLRLS
jgi:hypothetical protein